MSTSSNTTLSLKARSFSLPGRILSLAFASLCISAFSFGQNNIFITSPANASNADHNTDLSVNVSYQTGGGGYQTPTWAYKIDSSFPTSYQSSHGGIQVTNHTTVSDFLVGQANGMRNVHVALLDQAGNLLNPVVTASVQVNYQSGGGNYQSGGGGNQSGGGGSKVLYNTSTHQVLTQSQVLAGGTGWILLDANNANYSSYQHPAYYNTSTHGVLDNSPNDMEAGWILTFQQGGNNNNYQSQGGGYSGPYQNTGNLKTDSRNALFDDYIEFKGLYSVSKLKHDYNTSTYFNQSIDALISQLQALPMPPSTSRGDAVDQWITANFDSSNKFDHHKTLPTFDMTVVGNLDLNDSGALKTLAGNHGSIYFQVYVGHQDDNSTAKILYNPTTYQSVTPFKVQAGGTDWMVLNPNSYPNYSHPAYYNISIHKALDQSPGDTAGDWILTEQVLYNPATHQVVTQKQIAAGGTGWMVLPSGQPGYSHPAYYNTVTHQVLDQNTTSAGGWMITGTSSGGQSGGTQKVIWALSIEEGDGNRSNIMVDMAGKVYNGDFNSYWHTVHGIETWNSSQWHETHYSANSAGIESLLLAHPVIFDPTSEVHTIKPFDFVADAQVALGSQSSLVQLAANHGKIYFQKYRFPEANSTQASTPAKVLYNTGTHQVLTPEQIQSGTTGWMLLDPSKYPNYSHPAYYNLAIHKVLDSSPGSSVADNSGNWILTEQSGNSHGGNQQMQSDTLNPLDIVSGKDRDQGYQADGGISKVLYNTATHQVLSKSQVQAGGTGWLLLESNNSNYATYDHPAYYNTSSHQVLQNKAGSKVGDWILTNPQSGGQNTTHVSTDSNGSQVGAFMPYTGPYTVPSFDLRIDARNALFDDHIENKGLNSVAKLKADYNTTKAFNDSIDVLVANLPGLAAPPSTARGDAIDNWIKGEFEQVKTLDPKKEAAFVWVLSLEEPTNNGVNKVIDMHGNVYDTDYESYWLSVYGVATHKDPNWSEVEYDATSTGIAKLIQDHPFVDPSVAVESKYKMAVVETDDPQVQGSTLQLSGSLRDSNGTTIMQVGFLISSQGHPSITDPNSQTISASNVNNLLTASYVVPSGGVYYVRTFAETKGGYSEGPVRKVEVFVNDLSSSDPKVVALAMIREGTIELAGGWRQSSWFGLYLDHGNGWIYHQVHGWLYMIHDGQNGIWTWQQQRKWVWTSKELYPYLYQADPASWLYLLGIVNGKAVFFNYGTNQIEIR